MAIISDSDGVLNDRNYTAEKLIFAERRGCELADEFTRLEIQIAAIFIAFTSLFVEQLRNPDLLAQIGWPLLAFLKGLQAGALLSLALSLAAGLLHLKRKEGWWDGCHHERVEIMKVWAKVVEGEINDLNQARAIIQGIRSVRKGEIVRSPMWTWILQTIFLSIGVILLMVLFLLLIFL